MNIDHAKRMLAHLEKQGVAGKAAKYTPTLQQKAKYAATREAKRQAQYAEGRRAADHYPKFWVWAERPDGYRGQGCLGAFPTHADAEETAAILRTRVRPGVRIYVVTMTGPMRLEGFIAGDEGHYEFRDSILLPNTSVPRKVRDRKLNSAL